MSITLDRLQAQLDYDFSDPVPATLALTHRSASRRNNERLEFLGDALLDFVVAEMLYRRYPDASEGDLSRQRAAVVNKSALAKVGRGLDLGELLRLGTGESRSGGRQRDSILADTVEALIAAVYLDGGLEPCRAVVEHLLGALVASPKLAESGKDFKTRLQELMQSRGLPLPQYLVVDITGEAHEQTFFVECSVESLAESARGSGASKRLAEQEAARLTLYALGEIE